MNLTKAQQVVYDFLRSKGPATGREIDDGTGNPSAHKRLSELRALGLIQEAGKKLFGNASVALWHIFDPDPVLAEYKITFRKSGRATVVSQIDGTTLEYDHASFEAHTGVRQDGSRYRYNGKKLFLIHLWSGQTNRPEGPRDLNG